ncbi:glycosyltransferase family 2 protein [Micromonospora sp. R77]|uniref:glycosyltransferase family 2 protein n=2 Tax=Micromonospora sp. R77 TaxID=2925836 RepID=UPI001F6212F1|nr:glycosyltransferase family 2 protein [Micromonospora sp. R77]
MPTQIDVVLPCLDEAAALPGVLAALPPGYRAIVVDNGSRDGSPEVAVRHGARVVHEPRRGYGAAVHTGVEAAESDLVCVLDADGSFDPGELPALVAPVAAGTADLAVGRRRPVRAGVWPWHAGPAPRWSPRCCGTEACRCRTSAPSGWPAARRCSGSASPTGPSAIPSNC